MKGGEACHYVYLALSRKSLFITDFVSRRLAISGRESISGSTYSEEMKTVSAESDYESDFYQKYPDSDLEDMSDLESCGRS